MVPIEILIPSLCLNLIYIILKLIENKNRYCQIYHRLTKSRDNLEKSIKDYKESITTNEIDNNACIDDIESFIETMDELLSDSIIFKNI